MKTLALAIALLVFAPTVHADLMSISNPASPLSPLNPAHPASPLNANSQAAMQDSGPTKAQKLEAAKSVGLGENDSIEFTITSLGIPSGGGDLVGEPEYGYIVRVCVPESGCSEGAYSQKAVRALKLATGIRQILRVEAEKLGETVLQRGAAPLIFVVSMEEADFLTHHELISMGGVAMRKIGNGTSFFLTSDDRKNRTSRVDARIVRGIGK